MTRVASLLVGDENTKAPPTRDNATSMIEHEPSDLKPLAYIPVSRGRALERALLRIPPGAVLILIAVRVVSELKFTPSGVSNRITEYSVALIMLVVALTGLILVLRGLRWLALALWPAAVGITADAGALTFRMGPFGTRRYPTDALDVSYAFERSVDADDDDNLYESFLDPEVQMESYLPRIVHPDASVPLERLILHYARGTERQLAVALRPFTDDMRRNRPNIA